MHRVRSSADQSLLVRVGRRAHRATTAAVALGAVAAAFSYVWFTAYAGGFLNPSAPLLYAATVANAAGVAYVAWPRLVPEESWSYRQGAVAGVVLSGASHLTIGFVWVAVAYLDEVGARNVGQFLGASLFLSAWSVVLTFGVPTVLSLAVALGLTYCRRRAGNRTVRPDGTRRL